MVEGWATNKRKVRNINLFTICRCVLFYTRLVGEHREMCGEGQAWVYGKEHAFFGNPASQLFCYLTLSTLPFPCPKTSEKREACFQITEDRHEESGWRFQPNFKEVSVK